MASYKKHLTFFWAYIFRCNCHLSVPLLVKLCLLYMCSKYSGAYSKFSVTPRMYLELVFLAVACLPIHYVYTIYALYIQNMFNSIKNASHFYVLLHTFC